MSEITVADLTQTTLDGNGIFDVLMRANKAHLEAEYSKNRIKGTEYSTVYLGSLESVMRASLEFLLQRQKISLEAQLMEQQVLVAKSEVEKALAQVELAKQQVLESKVKLEILQLGKEKIPAEIAQLNAQTTHTTQQTANLTAEALNIPKQGAVLDAQICKLQAEYDVLILTKEKTASETSLLTQKKVTESAQTMSIGVDENSVVGRQKALYNAQAAGFARDAEQKAADLLIKSWTVRRTTDEGTVADSTNKLSDAHIGQVVGKLLQGVGA